MFTLGSATLIRPDASVCEISPQGETFSLRELQMLVGGSIEVVALPALLLMIVNEEGRLLELPWNPAASVIAGTPIAGNALVLERELLEKDDPSTPDIEILEI